MPTRRSFGWAVLALAAGLLPNTVAGPLSLGWIDYPISETMLNQLLGLELVTTFVVVPVLVCAGVLALRGNPAAPLVAVGPAAYTAYMFAQYVLGPSLCRAVGCSASGRCTPFSAGSRWCRRRSRPWPA